MLVATISVALIPALLLLTFSIIERVRSQQAIVGAPVQFAPAPGATVLYDALLLDADKKAIAASLIDLAVRRKIRILTDKNRQGAPLGIEIVEGATFTAEERGVLTALFGGGSTPGKVRRFSNDGRALRIRAQELLRGVQDRLVAAGFMRPGRATAGVVLLRIFGWIVLVTSFLLSAGALGANDGAGDGLAFLMAFLACGACIAALAVTPKRWRRFLPAARPLRAHLAGLREYIALAEAEPLRVLQSVEGAELRGDVSADARSSRLERYLLNERLLPYAVLFGLETSWAKVLKTQSESLATEGVEGVLDAAGLAFELIGLVGTVVQVASAVGELTGATGDVFPAVGDIFDAVS